MYERAVRKIQSVKKGDGNIFKEKKIYSSIIRGNTRAGLKSTFLLDTLMLVCRLCLPLIVFRTVVIFLHLNENAAAEFFSCLVIKMNEV